MHDKTQTVEKLLIRNECKGTLPSPSACTTQTTINYRAQFLLWSKFFLIIVSYEVRGTKAAFVIY